MKVLALTKYAADGASSRVRFFQYLPGCNGHGLDFTVIPLLPDCYISDLYNKGHRNYPAIAGSYLRRILSLARLREYDVVWVEKEMLPFVPALFETFIYRCGARVIVDYDDAVFLNYRDHSNGVVRRMLGDKIDRVISAADTVTAGNRYLANYAATRGARDVRLLPSVVDVTKYPVKTDGPEEPFRIGWIGSPATRKYLESVFAVLETLAAEHRIKLVVIGLDDVDVPGVEVETVKWSEATEADNVQRMDIGIMPLFRTEWEKGKCGYKLIQYMAGGLPVVATAFGCNNDIVEQQQEGFLVDGDDGWIAAIKRLIGNRELFKSMSRAARRKVETSYSLQSQQGSFLSLFLQ